MKRNGPQHHAVNSDLTAPELQALGLLSTGSTTPQAAATLHKSVETVKTQLATARMKLGAHTTAHAVRLGIERGLI